MPVGDPKLATIKIDRLMIINVGDVAPDFTAETIDGQTIKLSDFRGKTVLLDFWATWCSPCVAEMPNIKQALDKFGSCGDLVVIGISLDQDPTTVKQFIKRKEIPWPQICKGPAEENPIAKKYNVSGIPATFLIDPQGKVAAKDIQSTALDQALTKLFPDCKETHAKAPEPTPTPR